jgi:hypothetical protein
VSHPYKVPSPVWGGTAAAYFSAPQYTGNVAWTVTAGGQALNGLFEAGTAYTAKITLTAASGYTLNALGPNAFGHDNALLISHISGGTVSIRFRATEASQAATISGVNLTNLLPAPITGATPRMDFHTGNYSGTAARTTGRGTLVTLFESGTAYKATVTLTPAPGYHFPASLPVTHGTLIVADFTGEPRQGTVSFPATGILSFFSGPFSGLSAVDGDSAIDLIRAAKAADHPFLYLQLAPRAMEPVTLVSTADIGDATEGLVLDTTNSPPAWSLTAGSG